MKDIRLIRLMVAPIRIAEGIFFILTLGLIGVNWEMAFLVWNHRRNQKRSK